MSHNLLDRLVVFLVKRGGETRMGVMIIQDCSRQERI